MREFINIMDDAMLDDDEPSYSGPRYQQLAALLNIWGEGWSSPSWGKSDLHTKLLALRDVAKEFTDTYGARELYRAFIPSNAQVSDLKNRGRFTITTPEHRPLASWSFTEDGAIDYISGFDRWLIIRMPINQLPIYINYTEACSELLGNQPKFEEVIVVMPTTLFVDRSNIIEAHGI